MRILIVEDDETIRSFLKVNLEADCYAVDTANDGVAGVSLAKLHEYDVIIMDNLMPNKTGLEACAELRTEGITTPILILSVQSDTNIKVEALNAGADDYLTKPFALSELLARVRALKRRAHTIESDVISYRNLSIDTKRHVVTFAGETIELTRKEFMLLAYLIRHQGAVVSRGMIMEHVWDMNADPFSNTIETHIASLRRKLRDTATDTYISTISGCGYRFGTDHVEV